MKRIISAMLLLVFIMTGCSGKSAPETKQEPQEPVVELKAFTMGNEPENGMDEFYAQLDELTIRDLNCTVRFDFIPWSEDKSKISQKIFAGQYDLYCGGNFSDFNAMVTKNAFLDLKPYLKQVPELAKRYTINGIDILEDFEIDGKLYGIPGLGKNEPVSINPFGLLFREDLRKKWKLPEITDIDTMEQYLYRAKEEPEYSEGNEIVDSRIWTCLWAMLAGDKYMEITMADEDPWLVVSYDEPYKAINRYETREYKQVLQYAQKWYHDGIISPNILELGENTTEQETRQLLSGKRISAATMGLWTMDKYVITPSYRKHPEWEYGYFPYVDIHKVPQYLSSVLGATCISVNPYSKYPELALKLIEKGHTDKEYYYLLRHGVEGQHYQLVDDKINTDSISEKDLFPGWTGMIDGYMDTSAESIDDRWNALFEKWKKEAIQPTEYNPIDGFSVDNAKIINSYTEIQQVREQYYVPLQCGVTADLDKDLAQAHLKMKEAGIDDYLQEVQKQLIEFQKNKKQ